MDALIVYWSKTGNTEQVALAIREGLRDAGAKVLLQQVEEVGDVDLYAYRCDGLSRGSFRGLRRLA